MVLERSDKSIKRQINALRKLTDSTDKAALRSFLTGQAHTEIFKDLYDKVKQHPQFNETLAQLTLSESQREILQHTRHAENGFMLVTGPPGTGKTHTIAQLLIPLMLNTPGQEHIQAVIATPSKTLPTLLRKRFKQSSSNMTIRKTKRSVDSTSWILKQTKFSGKQKKVGLQQMIAQCSTTSPQCRRRHLMTALYIRQYHDQAVERPNPNSSRDRRLKAVDLSLGRHMLEEAAITGTKKVEDAKEWRVLRQLVNQFRLGELSDGEVLTEFRAEIKKLRITTLSSMDVVITTLSNLGDEAVFSDLHSPVVMIDEAAKATVLECLQAIVHFDQPFIIEVGDRKQLQPVVISHRIEDNCFGPQMKLSQFARLHYLGHSNDILRE
jgi:hypothetical protein